MIAGKSAKQIFTASLSCALRSCIIDGFAKMPLRASIFASWYNKHNTKDETRDRFPVMCLLNRSEASRFAACTYGIISTRPPSARRMNPPGLRPSLATIESSFGKRQAACLRRCRTFYLRNMRMWYNKRRSVYYTPPAGN